MGATMKDIARLTGLGLATISSYFNGGNVREKNRIKIEEAVKELNFEVNEVARGLKTNRTKMIGIIIPEMNNTFFAEIITEAEDILRSHGYATMICDCRSDAQREKEAVDFMFHRRVDGVIIMPTDPEGTSLERFVKAERPIVMIDRKIEGIPGDCILVDNDGAAFDAVDRLIRDGHRRIGMIAGPDDVYTAKERERGYRRALETRGIAPEEQLVRNGNYTIAGGAAAMRGLREMNPDMTAVFVSNYEMTVGAMMEINDLGISVPEELSVIGFDNIDFARASIPRLSIVTQPTKEIAREAAGVLLERLNEGTGAKPAHEGRSGTEEGAGERIQENIPDSQNRKKGKTIKLKTRFMEGKSVKKIEGK